MRLTLRWHILPRSYHATFGGANARSEVDAFLGNLQTKIFNVSGDHTTNNWATDTMRRTRQIQTYGGLSEGVGVKGGGMNQNAGGSMVFEYLVQPQAFTTLQTGGRESGFEVEGIIFQGGRRWLATAGRQANRQELHPSQLQPEAKAHCFKRRK